MAASPFSSPAELTDNLRVSLAPILISLPIIREMGRAHLLNGHLVPPRYATAILSSSATAVSFLLLVALSRLINRMQSEVQQLNLRDELTGLYNFRGFNLLAEQAYRLAARSVSPSAFSSSTWIT